MLQILHDNSPLYSARSASSVHTCSISAQDHNTTQHNTYTFTPVRPTVLVAVGVLVKVLVNVMGVIMVMVVVVVDMAEDLSVVLK